MTSPTSAPAASRLALAAGAALHWYEIERVLGRGGFGITYLARDANLARAVAIKEYLPLELAVRTSDASVQPASAAHAERYAWGLERFIAEARTLARFEHPAIVRVLSVFEANGTAYMVMEYQQGESLQQRLKRCTTLDEAAILALLGPLQDGLEVIHAQGFIHRDVKPANIFVREDGSPVLLDFGSARQALGEHTQSLTSVVSPGYAPFEQYYSRGDRQGPWTDIYALGATVYRCLSGIAPMPAIDRSEAILKTSRDTFVSAARLGEGRYPPALLNAVDQALAFDERDRPQSVGEWRALFAAWPAAGAPEAVREPAPDLDPEARTLLRDCGDEAVVVAPTVLNFDARRVPLAGRSRMAATGGHRGQWLLALLAGCLLIVGLLYWLAYGGQAAVTPDWSGSEAPPTMVE